MVGSGNGSLNVKKCALKDLMLFVLTLCFPTSLIALIIF